MRVILFAAMVGALSAAPQSGTADAQEPFRAARPLVCAEESVLERLDTMLRRAGRPLLLEATSVGERSDGTGLLVSCAVRGRTMGFETNRNGMQPVDALFVVHYSLELRRNGIFIRLE